MRPIKCKGKARRILFRIGNLEISWWKKYNIRFTSRGSQSHGKVKA